MSRLFDATYTFPEYQSHLGRLLGLFEPLEFAVACAADPENPVRALERSSALREDLAIMGATASDIDALERCCWLPRIEPAGLYGYAYVILGSMMGGRIIVKRLRTILGPTASFHFYDDGKGRSESLWVSFCSDLEKNGKDDKDAICATAVGIFDAYSSWLQRRLLFRSRRNGLSVCGGEQSGNHRGNEDARPDCARGLSNPLPYLRKTWPALEAINRSVPTAMTRTTVSITANSAMSSLR